jgi:hypothetical protein
MERAFIMVRLLDGLAMFGRDAVRKTATGTTKQVGLTGIGCPRGASLTERADMVYTLFLPSRAFLRRPAE